MLWSSVSLINWLHTLPQLWTKFNKHGFPMLDHRLQCRLHNLYKTIKTYCMYFKLTFTIYWLFLHQWLIELYLCSVCKRCTINVLVIMMMLNVDDGTNCCSYYVWHYCELFEIWFEICASVPHVSAHCALWHFVCFVLLAGTLLRARDVCGRYCLTSDLPSTASESEEIRTRNVRLPSDFSMYTAITLLWWLK